MPIKPCKITIDAPAIRRFFCAEKHQKLSRKDSRMDSRMDTSVYFVTDSDTYKDKKGGKKCTFLTIRPPLVHWVLLMGNSLK